MCILNKAIYYKIRTHRKKTFLQNMLSGTNHERGATADASSFLIKAHASEMKNK